MNLFNFTNPTKDIIEIINNHNEYVYLFINTKQIQIIINTLT